MNSHLKRSSSCEYKLVHEIFQVFNNSSKIDLIKLLLGLWYLTPLSTIFQLYCGVTLLVENRTTRRKPSTCHKSLTNFIT